MGVPSKKYFHITDKIVNELLPSSDKREDLDTSANSIPMQSEETPSLDKRSILPLTKDTRKPVQKGSTIKKKNKKEQNKDNKENIDNYQETITKSLGPNQFKSLMINAANEFYTQFSVGRYSIKQWNTLIEKFVNETIESSRYKNIPEAKIKGYAYKSLENIVDHTDYKRSDEFAEYQEIMVGIAKRKEQDDDEELPY